MARYQFFSVPASRRQQYTYVDMASPLSSRRRALLTQGFEVEEDFIDAATPRGGGEVQIRLSLRGGRDRQVRRALCGGNGLAGDGQEDPGPQGGLNKAAGTIPPMARRQSALRVLAEHLHQLLFTAGFMGKLRAGARPHQHINVSAAVIVVIPLTVDTDVGIASRSLLSSIRTSLCVIHQHHPLTVK